MGINGGGPRDTVFGRIRTLFGRIRTRNRRRAAGGSTNGEARTGARRGMNELMAIG